MSENEVEISREDENMQTSSLNDVVARRIEQEQKEKSTETEQGKEEDLSRNITLGEVRSLIEEINGSFAKIGSALETLSRQVASNTSDISNLNMRITKLETMSGINYLDSMPPIQAGENS